jgi:ribosome-associated protein
LWPEGHQEVLTIEEKAFDQVDLPMIVKAATNAILNKKGEELTIFDMRGFTPFVDFNIIANAGSAIQAKVLMDAVIEEVRKNGVKARSVEGDPASGWLLIDFWDLVVHIFRPELRRYYNLDGLWADLPSFKPNTGNHSNAGQAKPAG